MYALGRGPCLKLVVLLALLWWAPHAYAREAVVTTSDGRTLAGELVSQDEVTVTLIISGIKTPIPRRSIQSVEIKPDPEEQYRQMRAELDDDDLDGRYRLAYQMYEKKWFALALTELDSLQQAFPESQKAASLASVVQSRLEREQQQQSPPPGRPAKDAPPKQDPSTPTEAPGLDDRLTEEQVNLIRVYEIDLDTEPRITIPPKTIDKLFETYASDDRLVKDRRAFIRLSGIEQLEKLFELQARELYGEVIIRQDSPAIKEFRSKMHQRYVLNYCAATACHGDASPGGLFLFRVQANSDTTVYTNFYILSSLQNAEGLVIDRDTPRRSLLLQYGLNRQAASTPHPEVTGWKSQFNNEDDARFQTYTDIIGQLYQPTPEYGISYTPPTWQKTGDGQQDPQAPDQP
jgi:hypothetical protein